MEKEITEGTLLLFRDVIWIAKGIRHPRGYAIALPRYPRSTKYAKTFTVNGIVRKSDCIPLPQPHIPLSKAVVYDPRNLIRKSNIAMKLVRKLDGFGCEFGLTGSMAVFGEGRDVDIIVYNEWCFNDLYAFLVDLKRRGKIKPIMGKWDGLGQNAMKWRYENAVLEGVLDGIPYSMKMVRESESCKRPTIIKKKRIKGKITT